MVDIQAVRHEPEKIKKGVQSKNVQPEIVDEFLRLDQKWRETVAALDILRADQNRLSRERKIEEAKINKEQIKISEASLAEAEAERDRVLKMIPNPPLSEVPIGKSEADNITLREVGNKPTFDFEPQDYNTIAERLKLFDVPRAARLSGTRFAYLTGPMVQMQFALVELAIHTLTDSALIRKMIRGNNMKIKDTPFIPVIPPVLINRAAMYGMGYLERGEEEIYHLPQDDLFLVGTSEQSIGPMHQGEILKEEDLPIRYLGFSTCFRREAGSYGKDTKGILRVHQFNKLEMFSITTPENSRSEHRLLLALEEYLMQTIGLPYRVLNICSADLGDPAAAKFDIEGWMPGQLAGRGEYRETHSTSNCTDYQARRLNIRYQPKATKTEPNPRPAVVHMVNGTAFSERPLLAILENYQTKEGTVNIPKALQKWTGIKLIS